MDQQDNQEISEVDGYLFLQKEDAQIALQEQKKIEYLEKRLDFNKPEQVLKVYRKAVEERVFKTPVGLEYMKRLQRYLKSQLPNEEIPPIGLYVAFEPKLRPQGETVRRTVVKREQKKENGLAISIILNLILVAMVIAMFVITLKSDNPNILNYERAIQDKYSAWEEELSQREQTVREKEKELFLREE